MGREAERSGCVRRFLAADFLPCTHTRARCVEEHPLLAERKAFREKLARSFVRAIHIHIGCFMDEGEFFGFLGLWDATSRTLQYWGDAGLPLDLTTWKDAAGFAAEVLADPRASGDICVRSSAISIREIADCLDKCRAPSVPLVQVVRRGSVNDLRAKLSELEAAGEGMMPNRLPLL